MPKPQVLIIGAGTGGLCLAHGLQAAGIPFRVFERDHTATDRIQGYRLTINANGARALQSCLPKESFARYIAASAKISTGVTFLDQRLRRLLAIDLPETNQAAPYAPRPIGRIALRKILLEGVEHSVAFGKSFTSFERTPAGRVIARFEDGSNETLSPGAPIDQVSAASVKEAVLAQLSDWSPEIRRLVERTETSSLSTFAVKSSVPIDPWSTTPVTLLGDALHNMTPYRGIGANTALRDAALLRDTLRDVDSGRRELLPALAAYEREMVSYGFAAVRASLSQMRLLHTRSSLRRFGTKVFFRVLDSFPALRRRVMAQGSD